MAADLGAGVHQSRWQRDPQRELAASGVGWRDRAGRVAGVASHDLRHTAASLAIASGASVKHVQRMLGHKDAAMTLNVYASLFEDDLDDVYKPLLDQALCMGWLRPQCGL